MGHEGHDHGHGHHHHRREHEHEHGSPAHEHKAHAPAQVATFVVTCSDSRSSQSDESGAIIEKALASQGHTVVGRRLIPDDPDAIRGALAEATQSYARAVIFNGGTGIGRRDQTIETLRALFEKELPGFGELFRSLSFAEIGSSAILSRATAGTYQGMVIFALPGSPNGVRLGVERLILPELGHAVRELAR
jgi:molybdenum cofactor biosynthesis protein B